MKFMVLYMTLVEFVFSLIGGRMSKKLAVKRTYMSEVGCILFEADHSCGTQNKPVHIDGELQSLFEDVDSKGIDHVKFYLMQSEPLSLIADQIVKNKVYVSS